MNVTRFLLSLVVVGLLANSAEAEFRAGAAKVDVSPPQFPVLVNGGMLSRTADSVHTPVNVRALVLDDGRDRIALVVVDSCMMPRPLLDEAKAIAARRTEIPADRILVAATHTHTAPACMGCLGTDADPAYVPFFRERLVEAIAAAEANLQPARIGWGSADAGEYTAVRRWVRRPDRMDEDPFGNRTVRANMHAAGNWDNVIGPSGPEDPELSLIAVQSADGQPLAVLANFSMHYFGDRPVSADYFGLFAEGLKAELAPEDADGQPPFVGMMSHGCSGDIWRRDYTKPPVTRGDDISIEDYAKALVAIAVNAYEQIEYQDSPDIAMAEARLPFKYRVPNKQLLEWAERIVAEMGDRIPEDRTEVYAREQIILHERQQTEVVVQAARIGDIALATTPTETYAITGLKIKAQSPLKQTMVFDLTNGGDGYIPPPEQHRLGGYNTWPARSAGLEVSAEPQIVATALSLLEQVTGQSRREPHQSRGPAADAVLTAQPMAYWRLDEFSGPRAIDSTAYNRDAIYEPDVLFSLEGPAGHSEETNRAAHFAGGRLRSRIGDLDDRYSVSMWIWNGMPSDARDVTGWFFSRGRDHALDGHGDHLGLGGTEAGQDRLVFQHGDGDDSPVSGETKIERWTWNHVLFVRDGDQVRVYLNGRPEIEAQSAADFPDGFDQLFFGGRADNQANWEGRLDEIAVFDRVLTTEDANAFSTRQKDSAD